MTNPSPLSLGIGVGRAQAFGMVAAKCSAAQARSMRDIRDSQVYREVDLTWEEFCTRSFGLSRRRVDQIIHHFEEFGPAYFQLSEFLRISAADFRQLSPHIQGETLEIAGQTIDIVPENAARIRQAIAALRLPAAPKPPRPSRPQTTPPEPATVGSRIAALQSRFDACIGDLAALRQQSISGGFQPAIATLMNAVIARLTGLRAKTQAENRK
jgi:hypothetical protein